MQGIWSTGIWTCLCGQVVSKIDLPTLITARVVKWAKVMFSQEFVCLPKVNHLPHCPGSEVNTLSRVRGQPRPPCRGSEVNHLPPCSGSEVNHLFPLVQGQRSTTFPPCPGSEVNHLPPCSGSEVNHLLPVQGQRSTTHPPPRRKSHWPTQTPTQHPGTMRRRAVRILLECILVLTCLWTSSNDIITTSLYYICTIR